MRIDNPEEVLFDQMDGFIGVFDGMWNRIDINNPLKWKNVDPEYGGQISLEDIRNQYDEYGIIVVVSESYLHGEIYRYGNYSDCKWYRIGELCGFA